MKTKRFISTFLAISLAFTLCVPVAAAPVDELKSDTILTEGKVGGKDGIFVEWKVSTGTTAIVTANISYAYNTDVFEIVDSSGTPVAFSTDSPPKQNSAQLTSGGASTWNFADDLYLCKSNTTTGTGLVAFVRSAITGSYATTEFATLGKFFLAYKEGKSKDDVTTSTLRMATATEAGELGQSSVVGMGDSSYVEYKSGTTDSSDTVGWVDNLTFAKDFQFATPAYSGDIAAPTVNSSAGGKVVLDAAKLTPADSTAKIQYGYSDSASTAPTTWQDSTTFDGLTVGSTYYFYAKVVETATYAEKVSAATPITVADKALTNLVIVANPTIKTYTHGDPFKADGMQVKAIFNDGSENAAFTGYTVAYETPGKNYLCKDNTKVTLKAGDKSVEVIGLTVSAKELTVTDLTAENREYKPGSTSVTLTGGTLDGVVGSEMVTLDALPTGSITSADVGNGKDVSFAALTISGADAGNYTLTQPTGIKVNITRKNISGATITLGAQETYDGNEHNVVVTSVELGGTALNAGDYTLDPETSKATNVEEKTLKINGIGNYTGTANTTWKLEKATPVVGDFDLAPATPATGGYDYGSGFGGLSKPTTTKTGMGDVTVVKYDGNATVPTNAGSYAVTFDVAEGTNYNAKTGLSIGNLTINQIDYIGTMAATDTVRSGHETVGKTLTLPELPDGASYGTPATSDALITSGSMSIDSSTNTLTYSTTNQTAGTVATITIPVSGATNYKNYEVTVTITAQDKQTLTITGVVMDAGSYTYGDTVDYNNSSLSVTGATAFNNGDLEYIYSGAPTDGSTFTAGTTAPTKAGSYQLMVKVSDSNADYMGQQVINFTIAPKTLRSSDLEQTAGAITKTYDGNAAALGITVGVKSGSLVETTDAVTITGSAVYNGENVGEATKIIFTPTGTGNVNYTLDASATLTIEDASITAKDVSITDATVNNKDYDGNADATVASVTIPGVSGTLNMGTDFEVTSAVFSDANASTTNVDVTINVALKGTAASNYHLTNGTDYPVSGAAKINQATLSEGTDKSDSIRYSDTTEKTFDAAYFGFTKAGTFALNGSVTDGSSVLVAGFPTCDSTVKVKLNTVASLASPAQTVIIPLIFTTSDGNYVGKNVTLTITLTDKDIPTVTANDITVTYDGNAIPNSKITGTATFNGSTVKGTWSFKTTAPTAVADSNPSVTVVFTPNDATTYAAVETTIKVTINKATPTGEPTYTAITTSGKKLSDAALVIGSITPAGGTIAWDLGDTTDVTANTAYDWTYTPTDTVNYNPLKDTITPYVVSYSGGGSYTPTYAITVDKAANGTVTAVPGTAKKGDTVTLTATPDKGYELDTIKALDKDGKELKLTDQGNGKYTFTMPAGKVTVKAVFEDSNLVMFDDVSKGDYCYEAVKWAVKNGITSGIGNNRFGPNDPCTRGQIVTFLWRAAGSPEPKSMSSFTDVPADSYYAKAVAWAVEKEITSGTGDGKFSPEDPCTRAQSVTFLYRAAGSPAVSGSAEFSDVASDTYYAAAVAWAAKNGITSGTGGGQFGSDDECSRGHIVTFLFNAYGK